MPGHQFVRRYRRNRVLRKLQLDIVRRNLSKLHRVILHAHNHAADAAVGRYLVAGLQLAQHLPSHFFCLRWLGGANHQYTAAQTSPAAKAVASKFPSKSVLPSHPSGAPSRLRLRGNKSTEAVIPSAVESVKPPRSRVDPRISLSTATPPVPFSQQILPASTLPEQSHAFRPRFVRPRILFEGRDARRQNLPRPNPRTATALGLPIRPRPLLSIAYPLAYVKKSPPRRRGSGAVVSLVAFSLKHMESEAAF